MRALSKLSLNANRRILCNRASKYSFSYMRNVHEGPGVWETRKQKLRYVVTLPDQPPDFAIAPSNPERPVRIRFVTHITMGGINICRL